MSNDPSASSHEAVLDGEELESYVIRSPRHLAGEEASDPQSDVHLSDADSAYDISMLDVEPPAPQAAAELTPSPAPQPVHHRRRSTRTPPSAMPPPPPSPAPLEAIKPFPFMRLPSELRIHVYRMALSRPLPILLHLSPRPAGPGPQDGADPCASSSSDSEPDSNTASSGGRQARLDTRLAARPTRRSRERRGRDDCAWTAPPLRLPAGVAVNREALAPALLRASKLLYREARPVLYADNVFVLELGGAAHTLAGLHQRSRSAIKHVVLSIPSQHDILEGFADLVRLGLRYCWGLKTFTIFLPPGLPEDGARGGVGAVAGAGGAAAGQGVIGHVGSGSVYANAFHILRWLPRGCVVKLEGGCSEEIRRVVEENGVLARSLDEVSFGAS